ncbi:MAG: ABC-F family ATP-binding cassette domain-containing protein, partial [Longimicrobiaceae bacterium]
MISVSNLEKSYGDRVLFADASFQLNPGERYGIVGANGSGKTTLLNILSGDAQPTDGTVAVGKSLRLGVLRQDQFIHGDEEVLGVALMGHPELWKAMVEKDALLARAHEHFDADRYSVLEETVQRLDGYTAEARAATILEGLGLPAEVHRRPLSTLSGGFKLRVLLAQVLAGSPDVLLLDEPTNHLDNDARDWLLKYMRAYRGALIVISHDLELLDEAITRVLHLDRHGESDIGELIEYKGTYSQYHAARRKDEERLAKQAVAQAKEVDRLQRVVDRFGASATKAAMAHSIEKRIQRIEANGVTAQTKRRELRLRFPEPPASGRTVLEVEGLAKSYGALDVFDDVSFDVGRGER